jgi:hypothetical protein
MSWARIMLIPFIQLYVNESDSSKDPIASFELGSFWKKSPSKLIIYNLGIPIADDIVTTLIYVAQQKEVEEVAIVAAASSG